MYCIYTERERVRDRNTHKYIEIEDFNTFQPISTILRVQFIHVNFTFPKKTPAPPATSATCRSNPQHAASGQSSEQVDKAKARVLKVLVRSKPQTMNRSGAELC